jgi:hypothetical protein
MDINTWFTLKIKDGIVSGVGIPLIFVPLAIGSLNDLTNKGI